MEQLFYLVVQLGVPLASFYHSITTNLFFNSRIDGDRGIEYCANQLLSPVHYLLAGHQVKFNPESGEYTFEQRFNYENQFGPKTVASFAALPVALILGTGIKAIAYLDEAVQIRHREARDALSKVVVHSNRDRYTAMGLQMYVDGELESEIYQRRPDDENHLLEDQQTLKDVISLFNKYDIPYWLDCGTLLGAYRYRGIIPWDSDLDIAILQPDFDNVINALKELDTDKYEVLDFSSRDKPKTYLFVHNKKTHTLIDLYHFRIFQKEQMLRQVVSNIDCVFMTHGWKVCEGRAMRPIAFDLVFPLKKTLFEGIEVTVPGNTKAYLQSLYGEDLRPAKIYDALTGNFEKDLSHPYWQRQHVR